MEPNEIKRAERLYNRLPVKLRKKLESAGMTKSFSVASIGAAGYLSKNKWSDIEFLDDIQHRFTYGETKKVRDIVNEYNKQNLPNFKKEYIILCHSKYDSDGPIKNKFSPTKDINRYVTVSVLGLGPKDIGTELTTEIINKFPEKKYKYIILNYCLSTSASQRRMMSKLIERIAAPGAKLQVAMSKETSKTPASKVLKEVNSNDLKEIRSRYVELTHSKTQDTKREFIFLFDVNIKPRTGWFDFLF